MQVCSFMSSKHREGRGGFFCLCHGFVCVRAGGGGGGWRGGGGDGAGLTKNCRSISNFLGLNEEKQCKDGPV